jgi:hypothetical protein
MTYAILDNGNLVVSFDRANDAREAFERLVAENAEANDGLLLVAFDDAGRVVDDCVPGARLTRR